MNASLQPARHTAHHHPAGLSADGTALADGAARDALRQAMHLLSDAELVQGSHRAPAMCQALTEAARALAGLHAYGPAESHLAQALRWALQMGGHDLAADLHCAWAEVATNAADLAEAQGEQARSRVARDRARDQAFEAARLAGLPNVATAHSDNAGKHFGRADRIIAVSGAETHVSGSMPTSPSRWLIGP